MSLRTTLRPERRGIARGRHARRGGRAASARAHDLRSCGRRVWRLLAATQALEENSPRATSSGVGEPCSCTRRRMRSTSRPAWLDLRAVLDDGARRSDATCSSTSTAPASCTSSSGSPERGLSTSRSRQRVNGARRRRSRGRRGCGREPYVAHPLCSIDDARAGQRRTLEACRAGRCTTRPRAAAGKDRSAIARRPQ